jgi:cyclic pyranopterin phosphate synthase
MSKLTHLDDSGAARMVDISAKAATRREAVAEGFLHIAQDALQAIANQAVKKGDVLATARIAGIMAAKRTSDLIPLCHPLALTRVTVDFALEDAVHAVRCTVQAETRGQTGVEMEALTAVQVGLLTIYDMCKAVDRGMVITDVKLLQKRGARAAVGLRALGHPRTSHQGPTPSHNPQAPGERDQRRCRGFHRMVSRCEAIYHDVL